METPKTNPKTSKPQDDTNKPQDDSLPQDGPEYRPGEDNPPEAPENAYSHLLTLQDGRTVRYDVGNDPHQALPSVWNNIPVVRVSHATYAGQENTSE